MTMRRMIVLFIVNLAMVHVLSPATAGGGRTGVGRAGVMNLEGVARDR